MSPADVPPPSSAAPPVRRLDSAASVCVIANPSAGRAGRQAALEAAVARWSQRGWTIRWRSTQAPGDATALARAAAAEGADIVAVAGGDGTVNEAANGLVGTRTALAVLPSGTANVLAAQLGLIAWPSPWRTPDLGAAADALADGVVHRIDVGLVESAGRPKRYFVMWAGVGADAAVVAALEGPGTALKARLGAWAYAIVGARTLLFDRGGEAVMRMDGVRTRGHLRGVIVNNMPLYAGLLHLAPEALLDDGRLDAATFFGPSGVRAVARWLAAAGAGSPRAFQRRVLGGGRDAEHPLATPCRAVRIVSRPPLPVHVDAEPWGTTPVRISIQPGALELVVPVGAEGALFSPPDPLRATASTPWDAWPTPIERPVRA